VIPLFSAFGVIFTIDSPFTFFWILSLYLFWKAVDNPPQSPLNLRGGARGVEKGDEGGLDKMTQTGIRNSSLFYWILLGISVGAGLLAKYTMAFFYVSMLCFIFSSSSRRKMLGSARPYAAMVISAVLFLPVIVWNAQHDWVTIRHTAVQAHVADGFQVSFMSLIEFIGSQLGLLTPVICVLLLVALWKIRGKDFETTSGNGAFLFWFSAPVVVFFMAKSLQGKVQPNWAMTGYIAGIIAFSKVFLDGWKKNGSFLRAVIVLGIALSVMLTVIAHYPSKFHLPQKLDPSSRLRGWSDLGRQIQEVYEEMRGKGNVFIFSDSYHIASELAFFMKDHPVTYCVNLGRRMNQYDLWPGLENLVHSNGIFVTIGDAGLDPRLREAFQGCEKRVLKIRDRGTVLRENSVFLCYDFRGMTKEEIRKY
ncbi:MAG TPA: glycosyltransferase family 39 protein, partial [Thermodesulfovibrionales bacterium]|nr:glycosyltransferase family 39 protein [Thermodesulfovibrionales bacterium]